jgi:hypothetical protein
MSWEYSKYKAICEDCGKQGYCIRGSDDWFRSSTTWEGFEERSVGAQEIARKRADSRDKRAICSCGSSKISLGELVE